MWKIYLIIFNLVSATNDYECSSSIPTLQSVKRCPGNRTEWIQASNKKHCDFVHQNCSSKADFQYHCLVNEDANGLVEVCLPVRLIVGHFCPFYNSKKARVENHYNIPCQDHSVSCPQHYRSNEVYQYQECYSGVYGTQNSNSNTKENEIKEVENEALDVQLNTFWSLVVIIIGVLVISILGSISTVTQLMRPDNKKACYDSCYFKCCDCCNSSKETKDSENEKETPIKEREENSGERKELIQMEEKNDDNKI